MLTGREASFFHVLELLVAIAKVLLLRPDDASRSDDPQVSDHLLSCEVVVAHDPQPDQRPRPSKSSQTVDCDHSPLSLHDVHELAHNQL